MTLEMAGADAGGARDERERGAQVKSLRLSPVLLRALKFQRGSIVLTVGLNLRLSKARLNCGRGCCCVLSLLLLRLSGLLCPGPLGSALASGSHPMLSDHRIPDLQVHTKLQTDFSLESYCASGLWKVWFLRC